MHLKQHTLNNPVNISGIGLHTGQPVNMSILPAEENTGIRFRRIDLEGKPEIPALAEYVTDTTRSTTISNDGASVQTVEHVLAALAGMQIDNAIIEIDAAETPAADGSSVVFVNEIKKAGLVEQHAAREFHRITESVQVDGNGDGNSIEVTPDENFGMQVKLQFDSDKLGDQEAELNHVDEFASEFANARTFCFLHEVEALAAAGLIKGGDVERALVLVPEEIPQEKVDQLAKQFGLPSLKVQAGGVLGIQAPRHENEPARHKLLDLLGDLSLVGKPLIGKVNAVKPGHKINVELAKKIRGV